MCYPHCYCNMDSPAVGLGSRGSSARYSKFLTVEQRDQELQKRRLVLSEAEKLEFSHLPLDCFLCASFTDHFFHVKDFFCLDAWH